MKSYHLKWSSHLPNMGLVFSTLYQSEGLSDVTLACEDGNVRAHKLLLSTCSDYFLELFLENSSKRPLIVLSGVKVSDLRSIMQFIYTGEVNVTEEDLPDLLEVAEMLGVRGLKSGGNDDKENAEEVPDDNDDDSKNSSELSQPDNEDTTETPPEEASISITKVTPEKTPEVVIPEQFQISVKKDLIEETSDDIAADNIADHDTEHSFTTPTMTQFLTPSPLVSMSNLAAMYQQQTSPAKHFLSPSKTPTKERQPLVTNDMKPLDWYRLNSSEGKVSMDLLPEDINSIMAQSTTPFCPLCNKDCANFPNLRSHLQVHNSIRPYACTYCESKFARVSHLNRHIRTHTGERPFACERCGKSFARQDKLKLHMDRHLNRENKNDLMTHLMSPNKKMKMESGLKQESVVGGQQQQDVMTGVTQGYPMVSAGNGLWGGFPLYPAQQPANGVQAPGYGQQAVYPGMVPQYLHPNMTELQTVMKIGECSIKPLHQ